MLYGRLPHCGSCSGNKSNWFGCIISLLDVFEGVFSMVAALDSPLRSLTVLCPLYCARSGGYPVRWLFALDGESPISRFCD